MTVIGWTGSTTPAIVTNPGALADGQMDLNGLLIGKDTCFNWTADGPRWWPAPDVRALGDLARYGTDGVTPGRDLFGTQAMTVQVMILGDDDVDLGVKVDAWKAATARTTTGTVPVRGNFLGQTRLRYGRFRKAGDAELAQGFHVSAMKGAAQFVSFDPWTLSDTEENAATTRVMGGSGFTPPFLVPFTLGAATSGTLSVVNAGNTAAPWRAHLTGPILNPVIHDLTSGRVLDFRANGGLTLATGEYVDLDSSDRSVLFMGTADRRTLLAAQSRWWLFEPGTTLVQLTAESGDGELTVYWRSAYLS